IGYMLFNDHLATSEAALVTAFTTLQNAAVSDLVLDIRYNGGGYLDIASEVAYMIAGPGPTAGQTFELTQFNSKYPSTDPVTRQPITPVPFHSTTQGFSTTAGMALPTLNLPRVFVLTGHNTCSASESIINSLRGVNVQVIEVGSTTCGKPYGFYPQDNCGTTYFSIEFRGVNAANFGDYTDGFSPQNAPAPAGVSLPGCSVADDFTHALGDPAEGRLAAALAYRNLGAGACPVASGLAPVLRARQISAVDARLPDSPLRSLRLLRH
ncbi:MAG TPA: S41 family peptidase, partial [Steroidobacteraceae bacterium]